jgi:glutamate/tyrosine decarboxylase-like PLP-dependent enzyme
MVAGLERENVVAVETTGRGALDVTALAARIEADRRAGAAPCAVVATAGTTGTGALDPIEEIARLCRRERLWLHVDACYGGAAVLVPALRTRLAGIEQADSIATDPHKWFFVPVTAALLLTRHGDLARKTFETSGGSYVPTDGTADAWQRGIPTTRRSSGFAVWMAIRAHGWRAVRGAVARNVELTRRLEELLAGRGFRVLPDGELSIACARWEPDGVPASALDALQDAIARDVASSGRAWFATVRHAGSTWLRFNLVNLHTRERHIRVLADLVGAAAERATSTR